MSQQHTPVTADGTTHEMTDETSVGALTKDTLFDLLGSQRRRLVLRHLKHEGETNLGDLAERVAAWENGITVEEVDYQQRKRTYTSLQQTHLPTLDEAGVVEFASERGVVEATDRARKLTVYLEIVPERNIPWSTYYFGVGVLSCVLVGVVAVINVGVLEAVPDLGWAAAIGLTLTISAAVHTYRSRSMRIDGGDAPLEGERR